MHHIALHGEGNVFPPACMEQQCTETTFLAHIDYSWSRYVHSMSCKNGKLAQKNSIGVLVLLGKGAVVLLQQEIYQQAYPFPLSSIPSTVQIPVVGLAAGSAASLINKYYAPFPIPLTPFLFPPSPLLCYWPGCGAASGVN